MAMQRFHEMPFGARVEGPCCRFRLWAPGARHVALRLRGELFSMEMGSGGWWERECAARAGDAYAFRIDHGREVPDPAARTQQADVHGPSVVVDPRAYEWQDEAWLGRPWHEAVIYELHVGTFTPQGTFDGVKGELDGLREIGVTAIELMPVADFPGRRNWGYDGVLPFAPDRRYGTPEQMKSLVDAAHVRGLMVLLDVVYNHFGPEGNYLHLYAPQFFTDRSQTPWGAAIDFSQPVVRDFFIHNALYWLEEFHLDGLRLDAVHAINDDQRPDILEELAATVRLRLPGRHIHLVLENDKNQTRYLRQNEGAFDAQWNDDFHHAMHVIVSGEEGGYYVDFAQAPLILLARSLSEGFAFQGQYSLYRQQRRGEATRGLSLTAFVNFLQNHDQVGNRACGERLAALVSPEALRAATAMLLLAPSPPLLFMGQEWGCVQPFPFFCDFGEGLGPRVTEGRRREFARFQDFADAAARTRIPDPQALATFQWAVLRREDRATPRARDWLDLHRRLLDIRHTEIVPRMGALPVSAAGAAVVAEATVVARWPLVGAVLTLIANLGSEPVADIEGPGGCPLYLTEGAFGENGTLMGWGVACHLSAEGDIRFNGEPVLM
jgi:malto-oligosyltrehalose trehalohydrolase